MPFALLIVGIVLVISGVRDTTSDLFTLVDGDFTGKDSFLYWMVSILIVGSIGYIQPLRPISRAFLVLLIVVLFLSNGGFFSKFQLGVFGIANKTSPSNSGANTVQPSTA